MTNNSGRSAGAPDRHGAVMSGTPARTQLVLPTRDRRAAYEFLRRGLGLDTPGPLADDGVPEPLEATLSQTCSVMMVPTGGFKMVTAQLGEEPIGAATLPPPEDLKQCLISLECGSAEELETRFSAAEAFGRVVAEPALMPWGIRRALVADPDGHLWQLHTMEAA